MKNNHHQQVLTQLQQLSLLTPDKELSNDVNDSDRNDSPWFLQAFLGISGLLSSLFFLAFLSLLLAETGIIDSLVFMFMLGLLLSAVGVLLFNSKSVRRSTFLTSLTFAISVAGQLYVMFALLDDGISAPLNIWLFVFIQLAITIVMSNYLYRLLGALVVLSGMIYLLNFYQAPEAILALLALLTTVTHLQRYALLQGVPAKWRVGALALSRAFAYASAALLLFISVFVVASDQSYDFFSNEAFVYNDILAQVLLVLASLYAAYLVLQRYKIKLLSSTSLIVGGTIILLGIISFYVTGLLATSLIIFIAMANSQRALLGIAILALVSYIFWYYYQLDTTLLTKSISMLVIGIAMLLMRWLLVSYYAVDYKSIKTSKFEERLP